MAADEKEVKESLEFPPLFSSSSSSVTERLRERKREEALKINFQAVLKLDTVEEVTKKANLYNQYQLQNPDPTRETLTIEFRGGDEDNENYYQNLIIFLSNINPGIHVKALIIDLAIDEQTIDVVFAKSIADLLKRCPSLTRFRLQGPGENENYPDEDAEDSDELREAIYMEARGMEAGSLAAIADALRGLPNLTSIELPNLKANNPDYEYFLSCIPQCKRLEKLELPSEDCRAPGEYNNIEYRIREGLGGSVFEYISQCNPKVMTEVVACLMTSHFDQGWFVNLLRALVTKDPKGDFLKRIFFNFMRVDGLPNEFEYEDEDSPEFMKILINAYQGNPDTKAKLIWSIAFTDGAKDRMRKIGAIPAQFCWKIIKEIIGVKPSQSDLQSLVDHMVHQKGEELYHPTGRKELREKLNSLMIFINGREGEDVLRLVTTLASSLSAAGLFQDDLHAFLEFLTGRYLFSFFRVFIDNGETHSLDLLLNMMDRTRSYFTNRPEGAAAEGQPKSGNPHEFAVFPSFSLESINEEDTQKIATTFETFYLQDKFRSHYAFVATFFYVFAKHLQPRHSDTTIVMLKRAAAIIQESKPQNYYDYELLFLIHRDLGNLLKSPRHHALDPAIAEKHFRRALTIMMDEDYHKKIPQETTHKGYFYIIKDKDISLVDSIKTIVQENPTRKQILDLAVTITVRFHHTIMPETSESQSLDQKNEHKELVEKIISLHQEIMNKEGLRDLTYVTDWALVLRLIQFTFNRKKYPPETLIREFSTNGLLNLIKQVKARIEVPSLQAFIEGSPSLELALAQGLIKAQETIVAFKQQQIQDQSRIAGLQSTVEMLMSRLASLETRVGVASSSYASVTTSSVCALSSSSSSSELSSSSASSTNHLLLSPSSMTVSHSARVSTSSNDDNSGVANNRKRGRAVAPSSEEDIKANSETSAEKKRSSVDGAELQDLEMLPESPAISLAEALEPKQHSQEKSQEGDPSNPADGVKRQRK